MTMNLLVLVLAATLTEQQRAEHALNRLAFGPRPGDVERVMKIGVDRWIDQQLHPERIADRDFPSISDPVISPRPQQDDEDAKRARRKEARRVIEELSSQRIIRAAESERQLNEVMVDFWMNHFNVFAGKGLDRFLVASYERDTIRPRIWGSFEDLLLATAKSPAMLFYLDNAQNGARGSINENYAREIMELHTLGVDGGYTQKDVTELARVLTGWSINRPTEGRMNFVFRPRMHDGNAKTVLGVKLPAGGGIEEGERMIRFLARQPSTAHHIATKLAQRLVSDDPPKALVDRVAKRFLETKGDLRATVAAVIDSPEFWSASNYRAKMKSPFEYTISAVRAVNGSVDNAMPLARELRRIGQPLYFAQPPTGYSDASEAWNNSGALLDRINFAIALTSGKMPGVRIADKLPTDAAQVIGGPEFQKQ